MPVLHVRQHGVPEAGPELGEGEELLMMWSNVRLVVSPDNKDLGVGRVYATSRHCHWGGDGVSASFPWTCLALHAVASASEAFPHACIYVQLDDPDATGADDNNDDDAACEDVRLVPSHESQLEHLFNELAKYVAMNPVEGDEQAGFAGPPTGLSGMFTAADFEDSVQGDGEGDGDAEAGDASAQFADADEQHAEPDVEPHPRQM